MKKKISAHKGSMRKVTKVGIKRDTGYLHFVDKKGSISSAKMARGASKKKAVANYKGYKQSVNSPLLIPSDIEIQPEKITVHLQNALDGVNGLLAQLINKFDHSYKINEIELSLSFNTKGQFLGISAGGKGTVTLRVRPKK